MGFYIGGEVKKTTLYMFKIRPGHGRGVGPGGGGPGEAGAWPAVPVHGVPCLPSSHLIMLELGLELLLDFLESDSPSCSTTSPASLSHTYSRLSIYSLSYWRRQ